MKIRQIFPFLEWLPKYQREDLKGDLTAGLTVAVILVPQGLAYSFLAGLPPVYGLYAGIVPLFLYAFFGTSRQLSVGPVALLSLLVLSGLENFAEPFSASFITLAITTALMAGIIQLLLGVLRLGFLVNFLSHPVISGFTSAAAFIIAFSQIKNLLGIEMPQSNQIQVIATALAQRITDVHFPTLLISIAGIVVMYYLKRIRKNLPYAIITVILGTLAVRLFDLNQIGVAIVGEIPAGLPKPIVPELNLQLIMQLMPLSLTICLISFIESLAIAKTIAAQHKSYRVDPDQELLALGITKVGGAFFQSFPTTGSFTRSAINNDAGARTGVASIISAGLMALTLLFLTPLFYYLPKAILAAIIVMAVTKLVDYKEMKALWKNDRRDFVTLMATFIATLTLGIQMGVMAGVVLSLAILVYQNSRPHVAVLGRLPKTTAYRNIARFDRAKMEEEVLIVRFDAQLYFGNADYFRKMIEELVAGRNDEVKLLVLDASNVHDIDSSGMHILSEVIDYLRYRNIRFCLTGVIGPVRDTLFRTGMMEKIGKQNHFLKIHDAVENYQGQRKGNEKNWSSDAVQTNWDKRTKDNH